MDIQQLLEMNKSMCPLFVTAGVRESGDAGSALGACATGGDAGEEAAPAPREGESPSGGGGDRGTAAVSALGNCGSGSDTVPLTLNLTLLPAAAGASSTVAEG